MDEKLLEIREYTGPGYRPVIDFETWRVAILNYLDEIHPERIDSVERHNETDEVFVMLKGQGILFLGEGEVQVERIYPEVMESGKMYNVKRGVWHTVVLSRDGSVLIVENRNTSRENSDYSLLEPKQQSLIFETAKREQPDWWR
jgi:mannose-6-phosphate isomerase-like protein (cupin superfamily)